LADCLAKAAENLDGWQRARADLANYKKRVERERAEAYQHTAGTILARLFPVLDDFDRAMKDAPDDPALRQWVEGMALIQRKLQGIVENEGVKRIEAEGEMFDPNIHEAITHDESENHSEGQVIEVVRKGYRLGDRVLRPALVRVAK
jgi:molecular chaperone GrpE